MVIPCVNCKKEFGVDDGLWWEKLFLCPDCHKVAERIHAQGEKRLRWMLSTLKSAIKDALIEGRLQFSTPEEQGEAGESRFLHQLQQLAHLSRAAGIRQEGHNGSRKPDD